MLFSLSFFLLCYCDHRDLHVLTHSFPTRRPSDLTIVNPHYPPPPSPSPLRPPHMPSSRGLRTRKGAESCGKSATRREKGGKKEGGGLGDRERNSMECRH